MIEEQIRFGDEIRAGWKKQILKEIEKGGCPERFIPDNIQNDFDENEWEW